MPGPGAGVGDVTRLGGGISHTTQSVTLTDLICEGPIRGLVGAESGVYMNDAMSVPKESAGVYSIDGVMTVTTTNGSTTATINNPPEDFKIDLDQSTLVQKRWVTVQDFTGPISVNISGTASLPRSSVADRSVRKISVVGGATSLTAAMMSDKTKIGDSLNTYIPAHVVPDDATLYATGKEPIAGWLSYALRTDSGSKNTAVFTPGSNFNPSGFTLRNGTYKLFVDKIAEIASISADSTTLTLKSAWSGNPSSSGTPYSFTITGTHSNGYISTIHDFMNNYPGVQTQFRTGREVQAPFSGKAGTGSVAISNSPSAGGTMIQAMSY